MENTRKNTVLRIILLIVGILSLISVGFLYLVANPTIGFTLQVVISVALIVYAVLFNRIPGKIHVAIVAVCLIPITFVGFLFTYGNISNADFTEDVVIVLGAGINGETVSRPLYHRLNAAVDYWRQNPSAYIIVCGGLGNRAVITEAEAMARHLIARGVPREQILLEDRSTSTYENLTFAKEILDEKFPQGFRSVLITNDFHIYRAVMTARQVGIYPNRVGAYTDFYTWPVNYLREMLAVINLWVRGT